MADTSSFVDKETLSRYVAFRKKHKGDLKDEYVLYSSSPFGQFANSIFESVSLNLIKKYPQYFKSLFNVLRASYFPILSKTYVSIILLVGLASYPVFFILLLLLFGFSITGFLNTFLLSLFGAGLALFLAYQYPSFLVSSRQRKLKNDLPFAVIHMAAVGGSGAHPSSMFNLIATSDEYKGVHPEFKRVLNAVNLFGYDLSTALRSVADSTGSRDIRDFFGGMATTIESGGSMKEFLDSKSEDLMVTYRLERKKFIESLSTYSDIYISLSIGGPLFFFIFLAILNLLGGSVGGVAIGTLATIGTFVILPLINLGFLAFLKFSSLE